MAESFAPESPAAAGPALPSTADQAPYVPVSWLAVAGAASAALLALLLAIMGFFAFRAKRPLLEEELLVLAVLAIVFSFAARRVIRNSEGTRTGHLFGIDLPNAAWWGGLVLGLGYVSYLLAIEFSIRKDAQNEVQVWSEYLLKGDPESMDRAFHRTQDPGQRKLIPPSDGKQMEGRWGKEYIAFRQSDLRRLIVRNEGESRLDLGGLRDWKYMPTGIECVYTATLVCPEGTFPLQIPVKGMEGSAAGTDSGGRQWQIVHSSAGYIDKERSRLTPYGWFIAQLGLSGSEVSRQIMAASSTTREIRAGVYTDFASKDKETLEFFKPLTLNAVHARSSVTGIAAAYAFAPGTAFLDFAATRLFKLPNGAEPDEARLNAFKQAWNSTGIARAGERLRESSDTNDQITVTESAVFYRLPIEVPLPSTRGEIIAARGRLVLQCNDPEIMSELKRLKASADPAVGTDRPDSADFGSRPIAWRLLRIESELKAVKSEPPKGIPMPGAGGPPGGG